MKFAIVNMSTLVMVSIAAAHIVSGAKRSKTAAPEVDACCNVSVVVLAATAVFTGVPCLAHCCPPPC